MKKVISLFLVLLMIVSIFAACGNNDSAKLANVLDTDSNDIVSMKSLKQNKTNKTVGFQLELPEKGEEIAVVETNMGTFKIRFFAEEAPKAVYNFKKLAQNGYYDGMTFHRIIENFMIQSGDPTATGFGGESIWGDSFDDEFNSNLLNITGSLSMANKGPNTNSSQFFINYTEYAPDWDYYQSFYDAYKTQADVINEYYGGCPDLSKIPADVKELYDIYGGNLNLDGAFNTAGRGHTVFGQVFEGLEVVAKISRKETDDNDKPVDLIVINSVRIEIYE